MYHNNNWLNQIHPAYAFQVTVAGRKRVTLPLISQLSTFFYYHTFPLYCDQVYCLLLNIINTYVLVWKCSSQDPVLDIVKCSCMGIIYVCRINRYNRPTQFVRPKFLDTVNDRLLFFHEKDESAEVKSTCMFMYL